MGLDIGTLQVKAEAYKQILENTILYRKSWKPTIKPLIKETLSEILKQTGIKGDIVENDGIDNLESIVLDLGKTASGIRETIEDTDIKRVMIKRNGSLVYQQLFNGKIMIMTVPPSIEGYGQPHPPKPIEILRPEELTEGFIIRHVETFLKEITAWEDYDDNNQATTKQAFNPIGFNTSLEIENEG